MVAGRTSDDELPERLARRSRPKRQWREVATRRLIMSLALSLVAAAAVAADWIYAAWPPALPESNAHLEDFCSDPEMVFVDAPRPAAVGMPSIVYWIDKDTSTYDMYDLSNLKDQTEPNQGYASAELRAAALIACGTAVYAEHVDNCLYGPPVGEVLVGTVDFHFVVYEAASHEPVGEVVVENTREPSPFLEDEDAIDAVPGPWGAGGQSADCPTFMEEGTSVLLEPEPVEIDEAIDGFAAAHGRRR
jgi:hypothetical protein